jgi:Na+-transporting methylmalonyl-CoA/oxaloacetate decarboxylase gamma subunit
MITAVGIGLVFVVFLVGVVVLTMTLLGVREQRLERQGSSAEPKASPPNANQAKAQVSSPSTAGGATPATK